MGVGSDYFAIRNWSLAQGRFASGKAEVVVGGKLAPRLGETLDVAGSPFTVVGVLNGVAADSWDLATNDSIFVRLADYPGPELGPSGLLVESDPDAFEEVGIGLEALLAEHGLAERTTRTALAEWYGLELRETLKRTLGGALSVGVAAVLLVAAVSLVGFFTERVVARRRQFGVQRAFGATGWALFLEQALSALPLLAVGLTAGACL